MRNSIRLLSCGAALALSLHLGAAAMQSSPQKRRSSSSTPPSSPSTPRSASSTPSSSPSSPRRSLSSSSSGQQEDWPATGLEITVGGVAIVRVDKTAHTFYPVLEKTDYSLLMVTRGNAPAGGGAWPLFKVTTDDTKAIDNPKAELLKLGNGRITPAAVADEPSNNRVGYLELVTGPLPDDHALRESVRKALAAFIGALHEAGCNDTHWVSGQAVLDTYNPKVEAMFKLERSTKKAPNSELYFQCGGTKITDVQVTHGMTVAGAAGINSKAQEAVGKLFPGKSASEQAALAMWLGFFGCALQKAPSEACKTGGECTLVCNKVTLNPLPHVDVCKLIAQVAPDLRSAEVRRKIEADLRRSPSAIKAFLGFKAGNLDKWVGINTQLRARRSAPLKHTEDALLSPFGVDADSPWHGKECAAIWGAKHGFSNHDATTVDVLRLRTSTGVHPGFALEQRSLAAQFERLFEGDQIHGIARYIENIGAQKVACTTANDGASWTCTPR